MTCLTLDASVICKWFLQKAGDEDHLVQAEKLAAALMQAEITLVQPPHWIAEVLGVLARRRPAVAEWAASRLARINAPVKDDEEVYRLAARLAGTHCAHVFDTLYHAVALQTPNGMLVTADERYYCTASASGRIMLLAEWPA